jgi:hypothetical protein
MEIILLIGLCIITVAVVERHNASMSKAVRVRRAEKKRRQ